MSNGAAPLTLVHNRPVVTFDGGVQGVIDTGASAVLLSQALADALELTVIETVEERGEVFTVLEPPGLSVDGYELDVDGLPCFGFEDTRVLGLAASGLDLVVPASLVARHAVVLDMVDGVATFGEAGSLGDGFGVRLRARVSIEDGVRVAVPVSVLGAELSMLLDTGVSCSLVADGVARAWGGAAGVEVSSASVGPGNMAGLRVEARTPMVRVPMATVGEEFSVPGVAFVWRSDADVAPYDGSLGGNVLRSFRLGLDISRGDVFLEQRTPLAAIATDADQVGVTLVLSSEGEPEWTIGAVVTGLSPAVEVGDVLVAVDGAPVGGAPIGDVLAALGGEVGAMRHLALRRGDSGELVEATAPVQRLL